MMEGRSGVYLPFHLLDLGILRLVRAEGDAAGEGASRVPPVDVGREELPTDVTVGHLMLPLGRLEPVEPLAAVAGDDE